MQRGRRQPLAGALGAQPIDFGLKWPRIDLEQHVVLIDDPALVECDFRDVAGDTRPNFDRIDRLDPAGELIPLRHRLFHDSCHGDLGRRRRRGLGLSSDARHCRHKN